jgi:hypothetical protein
LQLTKLCLTWLVYFTKATKYLKRLFYAWDLENFGDFPFRRKVLIINAEITIKSQVSIMHEFFLLLLIVNLSSKSKNSKIKNSEMRSSFYIIITFKNHILVNILIIIILIYPNSNGVLRRKILMW